MSHKRQHIISETYLKYFSNEDDGKNINVLHLDNKYKKDIVEYNSGDKVFWSKNFYNTSEFSDPRTVELFFGEKIENDYNLIINKIKTQIPFDSDNFKFLIFQWVFYSTLRSPMWRIYLQSIINEKGINLEFNSKELREEHMQLFSNSKLFNFFKEYYGKSLETKKWKILISPNNYNWITSDNPGFAVNNKEFAKDPNEYIPNSLWIGIQHETSLFFPLTKKYCLEIGPYNKGDDVKRNFNNDYIEFENSQIDSAKLINYWTVLTACKIIISSNNYELIEYEAKLK